MSPLPCVYDWSQQLVQSEPAEFLHYIPLKSKRSNIYILLGGEKCGCKNDEKVRFYTTVVNLQRFDQGALRLLGILEEKSIQRGIIVFPGNMTPSARKVRRIDRLIRRLSIWLSR